MIKYVFKINKKQSEVTTWNDELHDCNWLIPNSCFTSLLWIWIMRGEKKWGMWFPAQGGKMLHYVILTYCGFYFVNWELHSKKWSFISHSYGGLHNYVHSNVKKPVFNLSHLSGPASSSLSCLSSADILLYILR